MSFFDSLFAFFSKNEYLGSDKKTIAKRIAKEISQNKYHKFYKARSEEISPRAGVFFYDMYKTVFSLQSCMKNSGKSAVLKQLIIEAFLSKELWEVYKRLSPESIEEQVKTVNPKELSQRLQDDMNTFSSALKNKIQIIDRCYNLILAFTELVSFDFFSLLKKMDPRIREGDFFYQPQFKAVNGKYLVENIKDFLDIASCEITAEEWDIVFEVLKKYKIGKIPIDSNQWKKSLLVLQDVHRSNILVLMVRHIEQNPKWQRSVNFTGEYMVENYIKNKKTEVQACISKITKNKRIIKQNALAKKLFRNTDITRLQYYTNTNNEIFTKRNLDGFTYIPALNYLKGFLVDYSDILDLCDLFVIRGRWSSHELSRKISQSIHDVTEMSEKLAAFDASLADTGSTGNKLKNHLNKYKMDKGQVTTLKAAIKVINNDAKEIISQGIASLTLVGTYLKNLHDDYGDAAALLINWKEIEAASDRPIAQRMEQGYKTIENLVLLLRLFISEDAAG